MPESIEEMIARKLREAEAKPPKAEPRNPFTPKQDEKYRLPAGPVVPPPTPLAPSDEPEVTHLPSQGGSSANLYSTFAGCGCLLVVLLMLLASFITKFLF